MSYNERAIIELLRAEAKNYTSRSQRSALLRVMRMIEAGVHVDPERAKAFIK